MTVHEIDKSDRDHIFFLKTN